MEQREWARELPRVDLARMGHFHAYQFPCEKKDHEDGDGAARPLGWFAAAYFLLVVVVGGIILPTLLTAVIAASTVHMGLQTAERQANQAKLGGVIAVAPSYLHPARVEILQELFDNLDMNGNGTLDAEELRPAFTALSDEMLKHMTPALLKKLFDLVDKDHGGAVDFSEFLLFFSRITSAMALRLGRAATEFVEDPVTFEKEFVRLMLEMAYGIALDDDDDDENGQTPAVADWLRARNATPLTINNNKNNDGDKSRAELDDLGEEGLVVKSPLVVHAAAEAERGAVAIGQMLLNDVDAVVGKTSIAGISHTPSTIFDVFDVKQLHRHIRWLASRLEVRAWVKRRWVVGGCSSKRGFERKREKDLQWLTTPSHEPTNKSTNERTQSINAFRPRRRRRRLRSESCAASRRCSGRSTARRRPKPPSRRPSRCRPRRSRGGR